MNAKNKTIRFSDKLIIWHYDENDIISDKNVHSSTVKDNVYENKTKLEIPHQQIVLWMILLVIILTIARG